MVPAARARRSAVIVGVALFLLTGVVGGADLAFTHATPDLAGQSVALPTPSSPTPAAAARPIALTVPPLRGLTPPDVVVRVRHGASAGAVRRLQRMRGVRQVVVADRGTIRIHHVTLSVLGVPLSAIRGFTPSLTASSTPLWQSVARGEVTVSYADAKGLRRHLGATYPVTGPRGPVGGLRLGAFATIGLAGAQALVSVPTAERLGLSRDREVLVSAPRVSVAQLRLDVRRALGRGVTVDVTRVVPVDQAALMSSYAMTEIPATYLNLYRSAAVTCPGLPWTVLAGIGTVETGNGRDVHRSTAGAEGPMQFEPSTWATWGYDADGDGKADIHDPTDAVFSAARYLCASGAGLGGQSLKDAIFSYNHAWWYVREVVTLANEYA